MKQNRLSLAIQGLTLIIFLIVGVYILGLFKDYSFSEFEKSCTWQLNYANTILEKKLPKDYTKENLVTVFLKVKEETGLNLELVDMNKNKNKKLELFFSPSNGDSLLALDSKTNRTVTHTNIKTNENELYAAVPIKNSKYVLRSVTSLVPIEKAYEKNQLLIGFGFFIAILAMWYIIRKLTHATFKQLEAINKVADKVATGEVLARNTGEKDPEIAVLADSLDKVAEGLTKQLTIASEEKRKLTLVLKNMDNAFTIIDKSGAITNVNTKFKSTFGKKSKGKDYLEVLNNQALKEAIDSCLKSNEVITKNLNFIIAEEKHAFKVFGAPLTSVFQKDPDRVLLVFHDVTALQQIYERQSEFVSNASHELATPLTAIRGFAEVLLNDEVKVEPEDSKKFLKIIFEESKRMQSLINDLLQLARLDSSEMKTEIKLEDFNPKELIVGVIRELIPLAKEKNLRIEVVQEKDKEKKDLEEAKEMPNVYSNKDWLKQVLVNLLENAIKYTSINEKITISYNSDDKFLYLGVHNPGEGLNQEESKKIFERFYRLDKARSRNEGGTGLGLSIVKFMVELLGGTIKVESEKDKGVKFIFTVPLLKEIKEDKEI